MVEKYGKTQVLRQCQSEVLVTVCVLDANNCGAETVPELVTPPHTPGLTPAPPLSNLSSTAGPRCPAAQCHLQLVSSFSSVLSTTPLRLMPRVPPRDLGRSAPLPSKPRVLGGRGPFSQDGYIRRCKVPNVCS